MRPETNRRILPKAGGKSGLRSLGDLDLAAVAVLAVPLGVVAEFMSFRDSRCDSYGLGACHELARTCPLSHDDLEIL